ncbi:hypothetical protein KI387_019519, partial [Taxus chinensis]
MAAQRSGLLFWMAHTWFWKCAQIVPRTGRRNPPIIILRMTAFARRRSRFRSALISLIWIRALG